jgi:hypothetical protein
MGSRLMGRQAKGADRVMRPPSDSQHVSSEQLRVKGKPCKDLAFRLRVGKPDLGGVELGETAEELNVVCGSNRVFPLRAGSPCNGVRRTRVQLGGRHNIPDI